MKDVHGHEILERLITAGGTMRLGDLRGAAFSAFGEDAQYHTCSAQGMSFDELIDFLAQRSKVEVVAGQITVFAENVCAGGASHDH